MDPRTAKILIDTVCAITPDATTLRVAEWVTMDLPERRRAKEFLHHYLDGTGTTKYVDISELLRDDPGLKTKIIAAITADLHKPPHFRKSSVSLPQSAFSKTPAAQDWVFALGSINMNWKLVSKTTLGIEAVVELSFINEYRWHPKEARITQCVHQAAANLKTRGAKDYTMIGKPHRLHILLHPQPLKAPK